MLARRAQLSLDFTDAIGVGPYNLYHFFVHDYYRDYIFHLIFFSSFAFRGCH